jgi:hypothetical protein
VEFSVVRLHKPYVCVHSGPTFTIWLIVYTISVKELSQVNLATMSIYNSERCCNTSIKVLDRTGQSGSTGTRDGFPHQHSQTFLRITYTRNSVLLAVTEREIGSNLFLNDYGG